MEDKMKLRKRIEHWADHNDEHTKRLGEAAEEAKAMGLEEVATNLLKATNAGGDISYYLKKALKYLGET